MSTLDRETPAIGSRWFNDQRQRVYRVTGHATDPDCPGDPIVVYEPEEPISDFDGPYNRAVSDWFGTNRHGNPRFKEMH